MGDDVHCAHFSFKSSSNLNIFQSQRCFSSLLFLVEVQGDWRDFCIKKKKPKKKPPPKNHATLKDTHKMYLTNTGNTKGRGNCLKKYIKIQIIKKKKNTGSCYSYHPVSQWMCLWYKFENPRRLSSRVITFQDFSENFWPGCWNNWDSNYHINKLGRPCCAPACCCDENTPSAFYRWGVTMVANLKIFVV